MMKLNKSTAVMDYKLVTAFESLRKQLKEPKFADRLDKPLAYWVIATDRRLPLAFMGRSLRDLLDTSFDELFATAGIGQKKIRTFLMLLTRAAKPKPIGALTSAVDEIEDTAAEAAKDQPGVVSPSLVSEALWVQWRASVRKHSLEREPLGRFAASLVEMPHVIWYRSLGDYTDLTLAQIRSLRTHGEKRVNAILEVFGDLHQILVHLDPDSTLAVRIVPRFLVPIEDWVVRWLVSVGLPSKQEIRESLFLPLLKQVRVDAGPEIHRLAENRLESQTSNVRKAADRLGLTRARIYQLLSEASEVVNLRWPAGPALVGLLRNKMESAGADPGLLKWFDHAFELLFVRSGGRSDTPGEERDQASAPHANGAANGNGVHDGNGAHEGHGRRNGHRPSVKTAPRRKKD